MRFYENDIGPNIVILNKNKTFISELKNLSKEDDLNNRAVLVSYGVQTVKGMKAQQFTNLQYLLPVRSLPEYNFNGNNNNRLL